MILVTSNTDYGWTTINWVILINFIIDYVSLPILHDKKKIDFDCSSAPVPVSVCISASAPVPVSVCISASLHAPSDSLRLLFLM